MARLVVSCACVTVMGRCGVVDVDTGIRDVDMGCGYFTVTGRQLSRWRSECSLAGS